tara:strand:- start:381 stop:647 length:267 start_codon:yes stop_codon:yes gene_type:complete
MCNKGIFGKPKYALKIIITMRPTSKSSKAINNRRASMWWNLGNYNNEEIASGNKDKLAKKGLQRTYQKHKKCLVVAWKVSIQIGKSHY